MDSLFKAVFPVASAFLFIGCGPALGPEHFPMAPGDEWVYDAAVKEVRFQVLGRTDRGFQIKRTGKKPDVAYEMSIDARGAHILSAFGRPYDPPYRQFAFGTRAGDRWTWSGTIGGNKMSYVCENQGLETVHTPAGTFEAVKILETAGTPLPSTNTMWLAENVGVVRVVGRQLKPDGKTFDTYDWKLLSFKRAP